MRAAARSRAEANSGQGVGQASDADLQSAQGRVATNEWPDESFDRRVPEHKGHFTIGLKVVERRRKDFELLFITRESVYRSDNLALELDRVSCVRQGYMADPPGATEVAETLLGYLTARRVTTIITYGK